MDFRAVIVLPVAFLVACSGGDELATVGGKSLSNADFEAHLSFKRIDSSQPERLEQAKEAYIEKAALVAAIEQTEKFDQARLNAEVNEFRTDMMISRYMADYLDRAVSDAAVENFYSTNADQFTRQQAHVAHIVFRTHNAMTDDEKAAAQQNARDVVAKLAKGESFEVLAQLNSEDVYTAEKGGDLGWVETASIDQAFAAAVEALEPGETSGVVATQYGYHIIKLLEPVRKQVAPLAQVEGDIRYLLRQKAKQAETERLLESVKIQLK